MSRERAIFSVVRLFFAVVLVPQKKKEFRKNGSAFCPSFVGSRCRRRAIIFCGNVLYFVVVIVMFWEVLLWDTVC